MHWFARKLFRCSIAPFLLLVFCVLPVRAALNASPNSIDFGTQPVDGTAQSTIVTLTNNTTRTFSIVSISDSTPEFSLSTPSLPVTLPPGGTLTVNVTFTPHASANFTGSLGFTTAHGYTVNVPLSGTGQSSEDPGSHVHAGLGQLSFNPLLTFGPSDPSGASVQLFTITNSGSETVTISNVELSGPTVAFSSLSVGAAILPGQSLIVMASYIVPASGESSGTITISSDAANSPAIISWTAPAARGASSAATAAAAASAASAAVSIAASSVNTASSSVNTAPVSVSTPSTRPSVDLTWSPSSSDGVVGYNVYRSSISGGPYHPITSGPLSSTAYVDTTVAPAQTFYYVVTALVNGGQESGFSDEVAVAMP